MFKPVFKFKDHQWEAVTVPEEKVQIYSIEGIERFFYNSLLDSYHMGVVCSLGKKKRLMKARSTVLCMLIHNFDSSVSSEYPEPTLSPPPVS